MHALSEKTHGGGKSKPAKPAEGLLRAVREEDHAKDKTKNGDGRVVRGVDEFAEHGHAPLLLEEKIRTQGNGDVTPISLRWWTRKRQTEGSGRFGSGIGNDSASGRADGLRSPDKAHDPILGQGAVGVAVTTLRILDPIRRRLGGNELSL